MMKLTVTHANVWMDSLVCIVKQVKLAYFVELNAYKDDNDDDNNYINNPYNDNNNINNYHNYINDIN